MDAYAWRYNAVRATMCPVTVLTAHTLRAPDSGLAEGRQGVGLHSRIFFGDTAMPLRLEPRHR